MLALRTAVSRVRVPPCPKHATMRNVEAATGRSTFNGLAGYTLLTSILLAKDVTWLSLL